MGGLRKSKWARLRKKKGGGECHSGNRNNGKSATPTIISASLISLVFVCTMGHLSSIYQLRLSIVTIKNIPTGGEPFAVCLKAKVERMERTRKRIGEREDREEKGKRVRL